jgi:hypothetical protein
MATHVGSLKWLAALIASVTPLLGSVGIAGLAASQPATSAIASVASSACSPQVCHKVNWSGYMVVAPGTDPITAVDGSFTVGDVDCSRSPAGSKMSEWVGIGGVRLTPATLYNLIQVGIGAACHGPTASYFPVKISG